MLLARASSLSKLKNPCGESVLYRRVPHFVVAGWLLAPTTLKQQGLAAGLCGLSQATG
jgi:hypothetical protein